MIRPLRIVKYPNGNGVYEVQVVPLDDEIQLKFVEAQMNNARWDIIGEYKESDDVYIFLRRNIAKCLHIDNRVPLGYQIEDYVEQCPYDLQCNAPFDPELPDEWELG